MPGELSSVKVAQHPCLPRFGGSPRLDQQHLRTTSVSLPVGCPPTPELLLPVVSPSLPETEAARHLYTQSALDPEDPPRQVFISLRIEAHQVLQDMRFNVTSTVR